MSELFITGLIVFVLSEISVTMRVQRAVGYMKNYAMAGEKEIVDLQNRVDALESRIDQ